jgi:hypothetical protein
MRKKASLEAVKQFLRDLERLKRNGYTYKQIGQLAGISNLSGYRTGTKTPGEFILEKFYRYFAEILRKLEEETPPNSSYESDHGENQRNGTRSEDRQGTFGQSKRPDQSNGDRTEELIETLQRNNQGLWANHERFWTEFHEIVTSNRTLANSNLILAENNQALINKVIHKWPPPPPRSTSE